QAQQEGRFTAEIAPLTLAGRKGPTVIAADEHIRAGVTFADLQKLPPVFRPKVGSVHAGNSPGITDGGAAVVLMPESEVKRRGLTPTAWPGRTATPEGRPAHMGAAAVA